MGCMRGVEAAGGLSKPGSAKTSQSSGAVLLCTYIIFACSPSLIDASLTFDRWLPIMPRSSPFYGSNPPAPLQTHNMAAVGTTLVQPNRRLTCSAVIQDVLSGNHRLRKTVCPAH